MVQRPMSPGLSEPEWQQGRCRLLFKKNADTCGTGNDRFGKSPRMAPLPTFFFDNRNS
jgi:hypothetical protein